MAYYTRKHWTTTANAAVSVKRQQVHATLHYPGFGNRSIRTAGWSLKRCFQQLRAWRNMHVGSGAYKEVAYNLYALPTGDVAEGRGNRQNGANGKSSANRAGMSVQVLIGDDEPLTMDHLRAIFEAFALLERWHPGITKRQYGHSHWVSTSCPGPHVRAGIPYRPGTVPSDGGGSGLTGNAPGLSDGLADVADSQRWLTELGYTPGPIDGKFGERTRTATKAFQTDFDITPADGRPGPATRNILEAAVRKLDRIEAIVTQNQKEIRATPGRVLDEPVDLVGAWEGQTSTLRRLRAWYAEDLRQIKEGVATSRAAVLKAVQETGKAQGLTDAQVQEIADRAADAAARVSAEDVAGQLEVTVTEKD